MCPTNSAIDDTIANIIRSRGSPPVDAPPAIREKLAREIVDATAAAFPMPALGDERSDELSRSGIVPLSAPVLVPSEIDELKRFLVTRPAYNGHVPAQSDRRKRYLRGLKKLLWRANRHAFASYVLEDVVRAPHLLELALRDDIIHTVSSYLGCVPTLFSLHAWWSFPGFRARVTRDWHRDPDDYKFCTLLVFLTAVDRLGGAHVYVKYSQSEGAMQARLKELGMSLDFPFDSHTSHPPTHAFYDANAMTCIGPAGTAFLADTYGLHKANPPTSPRLVFWARYGLHAGRSYVADGTKPVDRSLVEGRIELNRETSHITRLVIR